MGNKTIFRNAEKLLSDLSQKLSNIELENDSAIKIAELSLFKIDDSIRSLKAMTRGYEFESAADEIHFFKNIKPQFISKFIYHSQIIRILTYKPATGDEAQHQYFLKELDKLTEFYNDHIEFYGYYRRDSGYLDQKYFVRNQYDLKMNIPLGLYNYDESFTTSHDHIIAEILANEKIEIFLKHQIEKIHSSTMQSITESPLIWTESKVGLVELVYGLYKMNCFNKGNIDLSEVMKFVERSLDTDLGNYHKTIFEIRNRKGGSTKFLNTLTDHLRWHFENTDND